MKEEVKRWLAPEQLWQVRVFRNSFLFLTDDCRRKDFRYYSTKGFYWYRCVFIHIPKTAGVSVAASLFNSLGGGHATFKDYEEQFKDHLNNFFTFSVVRNPWDRLYSAYSFLKAGGFDPLDRQWASQHLNEINSFSEFILDWLNEERIYQKNHLYPQTYFLLNQENKLQVDFLARFETIERDFASICKKLRIKKKLIRVNASHRHNNYQSMYSKAMIAKVSQLYKEDIDTLHYAF